MKKSDFLSFCKNLPGALIDRPFDRDFDSYVARHCSNRKWFAVIMKINDKDIVNLKCDPMQADFFRSIYKGVIPAYHMNKTHWNTVFLDSDLPDEEIKNMTLESFRLTQKAKGKNIHKK